MTEISRTLIAALLLAACTEEPSDSGPSVNSRVETYDVPPRYPHELDVLVVIDDTSAMQPYHTLVASLGASLETAIASDLGTLPDLHVGVVAASSTSGTLRQPSGTVEPYLTSEFGNDYSVATNYQGSLASALDVLLTVGTSGATHRPLAVTADSLGAPGFLRDHATLVVVTVAAGDDASTSPALDYATSLKARKSDPARVAALGIYPTGATRLDAFHQAFPNRNSVRAIDGSNPAEAFSLIGSLYFSVLGVPCFERPLDVDPETPGPQYDCSFELVYADDTTALIPACSDDDSGRCYEFVDAQRGFCGNEGLAHVRVRGFAGPYHPRISGQCVVAGD